MSKRRGFDRRMPVVEVIWNDSTFLTGGWEPHADAMRVRHRVRQRSVGYVLADDRRGIMLSSSLSQRRQRVRDGHHPGRPGRAQAAPALTP